AVAALVAGSGHDQDAASGAMPDRVREEWVGRAGGGEFASADVENLRPALNRLGDAAGEVELGAGGQIAIRAIVEHRHDQTTAMRRDPPDWSTLPTRADNHH